MYLIYSKIYARIAFFGVTKHRKRFCVFSRTVTSPHTSVQYGLNFPLKKQTRILPQQQ